MPVPRFTGSSSKNNVCVRITAGMQLLGTEEFGSFGKLRRYFNICYAFLCYFFKFPQGRFFVYCVCVWLVWLGNWLDQPVRSAATSENSKAVFHESLSILVEQGTDAVVVEPLGDEIWWNQDKWIQSRSIKTHGFYANLWGIRMYSVSVSVAISFQALGCQGAPWTRQPQVRSKEGLDLRIESKGTFGSSNFAY